MAVYVVQPGDTLWSIARRFGVTVEEIMRANNLTTTELTPGQQLQIVAVAEPTPPGAAPTPPTAVTLHIVRPGETLSSIARRYQVSLTALIEANPALIYPGLELRIPTAPLPPEQPSEETRETECFRLTLSTDRTSYPIGTPVTMKLTKTNICRRSETLTYLTGQRYEFEIRQDNRLIWRWSEGRAFTQAVRRVRVRPGETEVFTESWPQTDSSGRKVEPGRYRVVAWNTARDLREEVVTVYVEIR
ncbi:MAG TPA: LysM peptidoglycan-binding domain-containing protein [Firmicutes bacterium]|nr:LysM peptidoglycan-binding domain-containing protein [Bacillota bacterium]